jgi:hypothetical protein
VIPAPMTATLTPNIQMNEPAPPGYGIRDRRRHDDVPDDKMAIIVLTAPDGLKIWLVAPQPLSIAPLHIQCDPLHTRLRVVEK